MKMIRLIELFAGIGAQAAALERLGIPFEHYQVVEIDKYAIASYNAIHNTNFDVQDIKNIHGKDLKIVNRNKYTYLLTYSFPCVDLSVAGKLKGMKKGDNTRSGLLWEVERILFELNEINSLPQILLMENVPQVHGKKNLDDFQSWIDDLEYLGYKNAYRDLNAKDFGIPQSRNRTFMISILDGYKHFKFPKTMELKTCMKDYLEDEVDEKFYITSDKAKKLIDELVINGSIPDRQTDRQLICQSTNHKSSKKQTVLNPDVMPEFQITNQMEVESVNVLGYIEKGTGKHQSNMVYGTDGLMPCEYAVQYKEPMKVVECKKLNV